MLFGESIPVVTLNKQPATGAGLTRALKRAGDSHKLCLEAGKAQGTDPKRHQGTKGSAGCQGILQQQLRCWLCLQSQRAADAGHRSPGKQRHGCGTLCRPSTPPCQLPRPKQRRASRQPHREQEERPAGSQERSRLASDPRAAASA